MASKHTKLARKLSAAELEKFLAELLEISARPTARQTLDLAEKRGVTISVNAAANFLRAEFKPFYERLEKARLTASLLARAVEPGTTGALADAAAQELSQRLVEFLASDDPVNLNTKDGRLKIAAFSAALQKLRSGNVAREQLQLRVRELEEKLAEKEQDAEKARDAARRLSKGGLSDQAKREIDEYLGI